MVGKRPMLIDPKNLVGVHEIAQLRGVTGSAVANWRLRYPSFPKPVQVLRMGPVFNRADVLSWLKQHGR